MCIAPTPSSGEIRLNTALLLVAGAIAFASWALLLYGKAHTKPMVAAPQPAPLPPEPPHPSDYQQALGPLSVGELLAACVVAPSPAQVC